MNAKVIAQDFKREDSSWTWMVVLSHDLPNVPSPGTEERLDVDEQVLKFVESNTSYRVQSAGNGLAGAEFSNTPWCWWFPKHVIVTQNGGRDV